MGTSPERVLTDKLGRRSGPRRKYSVAEKLSMVDETRQPGASVPEVAQRHGVNANLLSVWRRLERQGTLIEDRRSKAPALLPVQVRGGSGFSDTPISGKSAVHSDSGRSRSHETTATQSFPGVQSPCSA
jgi:transposase-like protein